MIHYGKRKIQHLCKLVWFIALAVFVCVACRHNEQPARGVRPSEKYHKLENAGCGEGTIKDLLGLNLSDAEVSEIVTMRNAGTGEQTILRLLRIERKRHTPFELGDAVSQLRNAGTSDETIISLVELQAVPSWIDDMIAIRRAGVSDKALVRLAKLKFEEGKEVIHGYEIAAIKNTGFSEEGIIKLIERGITSAQVAQVVRMRRRGFAEDEVVSAIF